MSSRGGLVVSHFIHNGLIVMVTMTQSNECIKLLNVDIYKNLENVTREYTSDNEIYKLAEHYVQDFG